MLQMPLSSDETCDIALLVKPSIFNDYSLRQNYSNHFVKPTMAFTLEFDNGAKVSAKNAQAYLKELLPIIKSYGISLLYVTDGTYFKQLTKVTKVDPALGYVKDCVIKGFEDLRIVYGINYQSLVYNPNNQQKLDLSISAVNGYFSGTSAQPGQDIIRTAEYPTDIKRIKELLASLHQYPEISADIEAFSLRHMDAGIGTISFAWSEHDGIAFLCDYKPFFTGKDLAGRYGHKVPNMEVRAAIRDFLDSYEGTIKWHGSTYDLKVLIYVLWMGEDPLNHKGMLDGLLRLTESFHDTKLIAYLSLNSCSRNSYKLKDLAHEFAGNYAKEDIDDIRLIPPSELLEYNLVDTLSTNYVFNKYYPIMCAEDQETIYRELFLDSVAPILQIELVGMPLDMTQVIKTERELQRISDQALFKLENCAIYPLINEHLQRKAMEAKNAKLKVKQHPIEAFKHVRFNPNSNQQVVDVLYKIWDLPVLDRTKAKQPAVGAKTLAKLINHTKDPQQIEFLQALIDFSKVQKILSSFIPAFKASTLKADGRHYLHGNFVLGGTVSGRLSSNSPNLQNLPSGSTYGKLIKKCFKAPKGWLFVGADFNSLEDYISALTTKDPNKLKVYEGHKVYSIVVNGVTHHIRDDSTINYKGKSYTGEQFYAFYTSNSQI